MTRVLAAFAWVAMACAPDTSVLDAATAADAPPDSPSRPPRADAGSGTTIYTTCDSDADCVAGDHCDREYPSGMCTRFCFDGSPCPEAGLCDGNVCRPTCSLVGGAACRWDQLCLNYGGATVLGGCAPSCSSRAELPELGCPVGACVNNVCTTAPVGPRPIGAGCGNDDDCATRRCEASWPGGTCVALSRMPPPEAWLAEGPMPVARCPDGSVVGSPWVGDPGAEGGAGLCLARCATRVDCRDGYYCERRGSFEAPIHSDGYCAPWFCRLAFVPPCEASRACRAVPTGQSFCITPLPPPLATPPADPPDHAAVVAALAAERPDLLLASCVAMGGTNEFLFEAVRRLRAIDPRYGLARNGAVLEVPLVAYHFGDGVAESSFQIYLVEVVANHCGAPGVDPPPAPSWRDATAERFGFWTSEPP